MKINLKPDWWLRKAILHWSPRVPSGWSLKSGLTKTFWFWFYFKRVVFLQLHFISSLSFLMKTLRWVLSPFFFLIVRIYSENKKNKKLILFVANIFVKIIALNKLTIFVGKKFWKVRQMFIELLCATTQKKTEFLVKQLA